MELNGSEINTSDNMICGYHTHVGNCGTNNCITLCGSCKHFDTVLLSELDFRTPK